MAVVATGGAVVALAIAAGAAVAGVVSGVANEKVGGSYINGWVGGAVSGGLQTAFGIKDPRKYIIAGSVNGVGSAITDVLDNIDPTNDKYKTTEEICKDACTNAVKGVVYSIPGAYMGWTVNSAKSNLGTVQGLMPTYSIGFGEGLSQFFGVLDNLLLVEESLNGGNKKNKETKE